jgi:propionyl-CoA synthetase
MPPSFMLTLWNNDKYFLEKYITKDNKYYITGDAGFISEDNYLHIMTRIDDVINVAGHRLSTGRIEEVLNNVKEVVEAAVVSVYDDLKGELPFGFIILRSSIDQDDIDQLTEIKRKCLDNVVSEIGAISRMKGLIVCNRLPKTRSGKIIRALLRQLINKNELKIPSTIEDESVIVEIKNTLIKEKWI